MKTTTTTEPKSHCENCGSLRATRKIPVTPGEPHHGNMILCRTCHAEELHGGNTSAALADWETCQPYPEELIDWENASKQFTT